MSNGQQKKCKVRESQCSFPFENYDGTNLCFKSSLSLPSPTLTKARFNSKFVVLSQNTLSLRLVGRFAIFSYWRKTKRKPCTLCKNRFWSNNPSYEKGCIFPKDLVMIFVPSSWLVCNCWWRLPEEALSFSTNSMSTELPHYYQVYACPKTESTVEKEVEITTQLGWLKTHVHTNLMQSEIHC